MSNKNRLFFSCLLFFSTLSFGQTNKLVFDYKQDSIIGLLNDSIWTSQSAERYLAILNGNISNQEIDSNTYLIRLLPTYVVLNRCSLGLAATDARLESNARWGSLFLKSYFMMLDAYFTQCIQHNTQDYIPAIKVAFKKSKGTDFDWYAIREFMSPLRDHEGNSIIDYATKNNNVLQEYFENIIHSFKKGGGTFSFSEMGDIIRIIAFIKISHDIKEQNSQLINEIIANQTNTHQDVAKIINQTFSSIYPKDEPGAAIVLMKGDNILLEKGYGIADITTNKEIDANTNFNIGSISKMFTATAILLLKQENKLSLQDHIIKYLPDVNPKIGNKITIYHLLTHSSGLPRYIPIQMAKDSLLVMTEMDRDSYNRDKNIDSLNFQPGSKFSYSNIGYRWLSLIVENISGMKFGDFVRKNILLPSQMNNSYELNRDMPIPNFAHGYKYQNKSFVEYDYGEEPDFATLGDGGMVSSISDFVAWEKTLRSNKIIFQDLFNESISPQIQTDDDNQNLHYGYGWFIETSKDHKTTYSHSGENGAFLSYFFRVPERKIMYAIFLNRIDKWGINDYVLEVLKDAKWY
jgi:CubicO group peptidase (beta-lactamase class C family)